MRCGDQVDAAGCPTCGSAEPTAAGPEGPHFAEALLGRVGETLEAQARATRRVRTGRGPVSTVPDAESSVVRRLRRQAVLLGDLLAEQEQLADRLRDALARVERALEAAAPIATTVRDPLVDVGLPRSETCTELARRQVHKHVADVLDQQTAGDAALITSELVNNAYVHGRGRITLRIRVVEDRLRIEVSDEGRPTWIGVRAAVDGGTGGWGLWIVERLSIAWGAEELSARVWADVPLRGAKLLPGEARQLEAER